MYTLGLPDVAQNVRNTSYTSVIVVTWDSLGPNVTYCVTVRNISSLAPTENETCGIIKNYYNFSHRDHNAHDMYEFVVTGVNSVGRGLPSNPIQTSFLSGEIDRSVLFHDLSDNFINAIDIVYQNSLFIP